MVVLGAIAALLLAACQFQLGGPNNTFGNDPTRLGTQPGVWAAINGPFSDHADGDPYATECAARAASATTCDASGTNPSYTSSGYSWAVDVPAADVGTPVTVAIYDPSFGPNSTMGESYSDSLTTGFATSYRLFETTGNANNISEDPSLGFDALGTCTGGTPGSHVFAPGTTSQNAWYALCTFTPAQAGIYPLQVRSSGIPGVTDSGGGINLFSVRATTSAPTQPEVYALNQLSFEASGSSGTARFYLANVGQQWAGHTMVVDLFDPGDGSGGSSNFVLQLLAPPGGVPSVVPTGGTPLGCSYSNPTVSIGARPPTSRPPVPS